MQMHLESESCSELFKARHYLTVSMMIGCIVNPLIVDVLQRPDM